MTSSHLERRCPAASTVPRVSLANLPTPVEPLDSLGDTFDLPDLWVKRDDRTGPLYGGNKVRKLEYLLGEAEAQGHERVWTVGGIGSHHVLATCIYARQRGLRPEALHFPQPLTDHVRNNLRALSTTRPDLTLVGNRLQIPVEVLRTRIREWLARGPEVYYVPAGGSSPTGVIGYVHAACELAEQIESGDVPEPDVVFVAAGTCGTLAGLLVGTELTGLDCEIVGVRVVDRMITNEATIEQLATRTLHRLADHGLSVEPRNCTDRLTLLHDYFGESYGTPTSEGLDAIDAASDLEDLELDPTYTGKTVAGLLGERDRLDLSRRTVLYWHTLNGVDLSDRIERADIHRDLPDEYRQFFDGSFDN